jgi:hypothetical protein
MRARYHPRFKTERELDDAIARIDQAIETKDPAYKCMPMAYRKYREALLYDLANRRDDGEIKRLTP